jgi:ubiquinol-cytochrome c reductase cytochrome b subunit
LLLPSLNTSEIRSTKFRPIFGIFYWFIVADFIILGWIGQKPVETPYIEIGMVGTLFYFVAFLILLPVIGKLEQLLVRFNSTN